MSLARKLASWFWYFSQRYKEPYRTLWTLNYILPNRRANSRDIIKIGKWEVEYIDAQTLARIWRLQFVRRYNDFRSPQDQPVILDCGANIGVSVLRYKELYPDSKITAFEPDPVLCEVLARNVSRNRLHDVEIIEAAIWESTGETDFLAFLNNNSESGRVDLGYSEAETCAANRIRVKTIWLGEYLKEPVDFIKMDIEGAELAVIESCQSLLHRVRQMMIEVHYSVDQPGKLIRLLSILDKAGFRIAVYQYFRQPNPSKEFRARPESVGDQYPVLWAWRD